MRGLMAFLPRLETALDEYRENDPDHAHDGEICDIYLASLNARRCGASQPGLSLAALYVRHEPP